MAQSIHAWIRRLVLVAVICAWALIGLAVWVPMLVRSVLTFSAMVVISSLSKNVSLEPASYALESSITLYADGFAKIFESMGRHQRYSGSTSNRIGDRDLQILVWNGLWVVVFYAFIAFIYLRVIG
jgi:hypothetical protein